MRKHISPAYRASDAGDIYLSGRKEMQMRFIHTGDIHLGAAPDSLMPWSQERRIEIRDRFYKLLEEAAGDKTDLLLIAGDLFHRQPLKKELREVNYRFSKMPGTQIVLIAGNHDYIGEKSFYQDFEWAPNVSFFRKNHLSYIYLKKLNTIIYGMSYDREQIQSPLYDSLHLMRRFADGSPVPKETIHILLAHGGDSLHIPIDKNALRRAGFDYVALGHLHKPWMDEESPMAYCGALEPIDRNDEGEHGYIRGICENGETHLEFVPFARRSYVTLQILVRPDMTMQAIADEVKSRIDLRGRDHMYKIVLEGIRDPETEIETDLLEKAGRVLSVQDDTSVDFDFDALYEENRDNVIGMYIERIRQSGESESVKQQALLFGMKALQSLYRGE